MSSGQFWRQFLGLHWLFSFLAQMMVRKIVFMRKGFFCWDAGLRRCYSDGKFSQVPHWTECVRVVTQINFCRCPTGRNVRVVTLINFRRCPTGQQRVWLLRYFFAGVPLDCNVCVVTLSGYSDTGLFQVVIRTWYFTFTDGIFHGSFSIAKRVYAAIGMVHSWI